ncbi:MAG: LytTR family transcriptional regulator DNA-binding domain-containing protein, partial [Lachnospiraceae bacterium]|nr:LytTR family transcriptional regulator DNA-binding domain-containing protein [Lachnospiraceae bacterium]
HARKPYIPEPLPRFLKLGDENVRGYVPTVTVHQNGAPMDVPKDELEYAITEKGKTSLHLLDNTRVDIDENITTLRQLLEPYEEFERVNKNGIANFKFVSAVMPLSVIMQSYVQLHISPLRYREFKFLKEDMDKFS